MIVDINGASTAQQLRFLATLNGMAVRAAETLARTATQVTYPLPEGASGTFAIDVRGLGIDGCALSLGHGEASILAGESNNVLVTVDLQGVSPALCTVQVSTSGGGMVTSDPTGIRCGIKCSLDVPSGSSLTLFESPAARGYFAGWSGECTGISPCTLTIDHPIAVGAAFYPELCSANQICWESPQPADINLYGLWGSAKSDIWAVGDGGQILHYDGNAWSLSSSPTGNDLRAVWGTAENDVFAVGANQTILHWDGNAWSVVPSPAGSQATLYALGGTGTGDVWAVGSAGAVFHYDGSSFSAVATGLTVDLYGVYAKNGLTMVIAANGQVFTRNGTQFTSIGTNGAILYGISGTSDDNILAVGDSGSLLTWNGSMLEKQLSYPAAYPLRAVHARTANEAWIVGGDGAVLRWNGTAMAHLSAPTNQTLLAVLALAADNVWAVGMRGTMAFTN